MKLSRFAFGPIQPTKEQEHMSAKKKNPVLWISLFVIPLFAGPSLTRAQTVGKADVVTAISNLENDAVKADLAGDAAFYQKILAYRAGYEQ
jgi:hypothetical protein